MFNFTLLYRCLFRILKMSLVWQYFTKIQDPASGKTTHGKCLQCQAKITSNGTSSMKAHLMKHGIKITLSKENPESSASLTTTIDTIQPPITNFFSPINQDSLNGRLAKLCASAGLPFSVVSSSSVFDLITAAGLSDRKLSPNTIKNKVIEFATEVQNSYKREIKSELSSVDFLSVGFDEWTSRGNKRYMNVILFSIDKHWNLGLAKIDGKTNAKLSSIDLISKLTTFDVSIQNLICIMSDGAAINPCIAKEVGLIHQQCIAHAIQLAVKKVLYTNVKDTDYVFEDSDSEEEDVERDELGILAFENAFLETPDFKQLNIANVIKKVRKVVTYFRKSPVRNDKLIECSKANDSLPKKLILDSRTRWNSLNHMLTRFYELRKSIDLALLILDKNDDTETVSKQEYQLIQSIIEVLTPLENCVKSICRKECTLYEAHLSIEVSFDELNQLENPLATDLMHYLIEKITPRFSEIYYAQLYLEDISLINRPKYFHSMPPKMEIVRTIYDIITKNKNFEYPESNSSECDFLSSPESTDTFYDKIEAKKQKANVWKRSIEDQLADEISIYENSGVLGKLLQTALKISKTVRPTTTDCERAFSVAGYFCNTLRSKLSHSTLSNLCMLKDYFNR